MSKKNFSGKLTSLLGDKPGAPAPAPTTKRKRGRPKDPNKRTPTKSTQEGTKNDEDRATFILKEVLIDQLKDIAYWDRKMIKEVVGEALAGYVDAWEKRNGEVKPRPKK